MDKLRAIEYFICAAQERSLSGAARRLDVSVPAVSRLIATLERHLGTTLFERGTRGLTLAATGQEFLDGCAPALERIADAEAAAGGTRTEAAGTVAMAIQHLLVFLCVAPVLSRFHARHPNIQLDLRDVQPPGDPETDGADLRLAVDWDASPDQVVRTLARTRMVVCAAPQYWARHGMPQRPRDLERHICFVLCAVRGTIMDHWPFERAGEQEAVVVKGRVMNSNTNRDLTVAAALAGEGVIRALDLAIEEPLRTGRLVPALTDWEPVDSPLVRLMYRTAAGRLPRVRATIDFLTVLFRDAERRCAAPRWPARGPTALPRLRPRAERLSDARFAPVFLVSSP